MNEALLIATVLFAALWLSAEYSLHQQRALFDELHELLTKQIAAWAELRSVLRRARSASEPRRATKDPE